MGDGNSTLFWHDKWIPVCALKVAFPGLFSMSTQKDATISQLGEMCNGFWVWKLIWRRRLYEWEQEEVDRLNILIQHFSPQLGKKDGVSWQGSSSDRFPIKHIISRLYESHDPILPSEVSNLIWRIKIPPRALLTLWMASLEKLKTGDFLLNKGLIIVSNALCPFCRLHVESQSHILFTCSVSWFIWMMILDWWGVSGVLHYKCDTFLLSWRSLRPKRCKSKLWHLTMGCVIWSIWFERNRIKFDLGTCKPQTIVDSLKIRIGVWAKELLEIDVLQRIQY